MAMTESQAAQQQQQYLHDPGAALAGPSSSTSKPSVSRPDKPASSTGAGTAENGPTPPSSPSQSGAPVQTTATTASPLVNNEADGAPVQQQPTPPSTLPEDAAFPQATTDHVMTDDDSPSPLSPIPIREPYVVEHTPRPADLRASSVSPVSPQSSTTSSMLDDGVPTLDANEAAFVLEADQMDDSSQGVQRTEDVSNTPPLLPRPSNLPRIPSSSSHHSLHADLPNLQIPQHSPPVPFQPHQTGSQYSFPYVNTLPAEPRLSSSLRNRRDQHQTPLSPDVPPWQPDSDVNNCPICSTAFTFFYRKHHCRKCGRVVCAPCSPHRIAIPKSYVVYPPNSIDAEFAQTYLDGGGNRGYDDGDEGVEVRICNDCLAGGNPRRTDSRRQSLQSPPSGGAGRFWQDNVGPSAGGNVNSYGQQQGFGSPGTPRRRTVSSTSPFIQSHGGIPTGTGGFPGAIYHHPSAQAHSLGSRNHQHGFYPGQHHPPYHSHQVQHQPPLQHPTPSYPHSGHQAFSFTPAQFYPSPQPQQHHHHHHHHHHQRSASSAHPYSQYSPVNQPIRGLLDTSQQPIPAFSMPDSRQNLPIASQFMQGSSREQQTHSAPPQPQPRLKETDYCPICTAVLPPINPVTKDETAREAHIQQCIENAVGGHDVSRRRSTSGTPTNPASLANNTMSSQLPHPSTSAGSTSSHYLQGGPPHLQAPEHHGRSRRNTTSNRAGASGRMVVYTATEKDTFALGNDAEAEGQKAECVICFEEFEAGDVIARLECFCRYHKKCISDWFNRRTDGQCPIHAMNE